jgi:tRNA pseudouridine38-40 synthase
MQRAAQHLVGEHDFVSFQASGGEPGKDTVRHLRLLEVKGFQDGRIRVAAEGNGFLRGMVRILVGTLMDVGRGRIPEEAVRNILAAKDRREAGRTAPGKGLFLIAVRYPEIFEAWSREDEEARMGRGHLTNRDEDSNLA